MIFHQDTLSPWPDLFNMLSNMSKLRVVVGKHTYEGGEVEVTRSEQGVVTIEIIEAPKKSIFRK